VDSHADAPNEGSLCVKGRYGWTYAYSEGRLDTPLVKKDGVLSEATWEEALSAAAEGLAKAKKAHGSQAIAALGSARLTNEEAFVFNRLVKSVLGSANLDHAAGISYASAIDGLASVLGYPSSTNSIREIREASVILLAGADLTESHPVAKNEVIMATGRKRAKVIVIDSIKTKLTERGGFFIPAPAGFESAVIFSMIKVIIDEGLYDDKNVAAKAEGFEALTASLKDYHPDRVASELGIDSELIKEAARAYAKAPTAMTLLSEGLYRVIPGDENARAAATLAVLTGHIGKPSCGVMVLGEKANSQGAIDMGLTPRHLPGLGLLEDEASRKKFETLWKTKLPASAGLNSADILKGAEAGSIKALYIVGENPVDGYPDRIQTEKALKAAEFVVVQDMFFTSTAKMADVVLPACSAFEKEGTFTSAERRIQKVNPSTKEKLGRSDLEIFQELASRMGPTGFSYSSPKDVMAEISGSVESYSGVSYENTGINGIVWPCKNPGDKSCEVLYSDGFTAGKAKFAVAGPLNANTDSSGQFSIVPVVSKFHSGSMSVWSPSLMEVSPEAMAEMCSADMKKLALEEGNTVTLTDQYGVGLKLKVKWSRRSLPGQIVVPYHFPSLKLNSLVKWNEPLVKVKVEKA
jgi:predicted molibdopterin-dependent oxidoreductase YjgC